MSIDHSSCGTHWKGLVPGWPRRSAELVPAWSCRAAVASPPDPPRTSPGEVPLLGAVKLLFQHGAAGFPHLESEI